jgi:rSAM/selenodomain-associated transferase 1
MRSTGLLIVFVRAPHPGHVKTRLARGIGTEAACLIYQILVRRVLHEIKSCRAVQLRFRPDDAAKEIRPWRHRGWTLAPQGRGDLGQRLKRAFRDGFAAGAGRVAIIGSDCPEIRAQDLQDAWAALDDHDLVLGPAEDGGYWLIAMRRPLSRSRAALFEAIPWSTERVLGTTLQRAASRGLRVRLLRELSDIDTEKDWKAYLRRNAFAQIALGE